jgi:ABC-type nitrate/sulfonate/bicarbonate transport system substrate-binding protein
MPHRFAPILAAALLAVGLAAAPALAADTVRAAKAVGSQWAFIPLDVGVEEGIFAKYGIEVDISTMSGEARLQQALTAGSLDIGLEGSSGAALSVKGAPIVAIADFIDAPRNFSVVVLADSPIKSVSDLKGKLLSGASTGGLPEWLVKHLGVVEGWGPDGIRSIAVGSPDASLAALKTHQVDGMMTATATGFLLEQQGIGRIVTQMGDYARDYHTALVFARTGFVTDRPDVVTRFLKGLFATIAYIRANKEQTGIIAARVLHLDRATVDRVYDIESQSYSTDGHFDPKAIDALKQSMIDMGSLGEKPRDDQILTTKFVPVKF